MSLAERIEAAGVDEQRAMLEEAWAAIYGVPSGVAASDKRVWHWLRFVNMLDAEAYESAAMMLVPEGMRVAIMIVEDGRAAVNLWWPGEDAPNVPRLEPLFATPALALAAAAIRAGAK